MSDTWLRQQHDNLLIAYGECNLKLRRAEKELERCRAPAAGGEERIPTLFAAIAHGDGKRMRESILKRNDRHAPASYDDGWKAGIEAAAKALEEASAQFAESALDADLAYAQVCRDHAAAIRALLAPAGGEGK